MEINCLKYFLVQLLGLDNTEVQNCHPRRDLRTSDSIHSKVKVFSSPAYSFRVERHPKEDESICETLDPDSKRPMMKVGQPGCLYRVEVYINNPI